MLPCTRGKDSSLAQRQAVGVNAVHVHNRQTNCNEQSPWETKSHSASQEIPCILWNSKVHCSVQKSPPSVPMLSQKRSVHTFPSHLPKIHSNIILSTKANFSFLSLTSHILFRTFHTVLCSSFQNLSLSFHATSYSTEHARTYTHTLATIQLPLFQSKCGLNSFLNHFIYNKTKLHPLFRPLWLYRIY